MQHLDNQTLEFALFILVALAMVVQAIVMLAAFLFMRKTAGSLIKQLDETHSAIMPLLNTSRDLITRVAPKIEQTGSDLAAITHSLRARTTDVQIATAEILERARTQAGRLDKMITDLLDSVDRASKYVNDTVNKPMRQVSAIMASVRAVVESLRNGDAAHHSHSNSAHRDQDMFV
jgi:signal transduction histidine kinase